MKVLIIENEIYLAQNIAMKLSEVDYECELVNSFDELNSDRYYDIVLLSTNTSNFLKAVEKFKQSIVLLLISYITTDTVSNPLKMGACDYIQKPFMIEELIRKIKHYQDFRKITLLNKAYKSYIKSRLELIKIPAFNFKKIKFPLVIKTDKLSLADAFVFHYVNARDITLSFVNLSSANSVEKTLKQATQNNLLYLSNFQVLNPNEKEKILKFIRNKNVILHTNSSLEEFECACVNFDDHDENEVDSDEILSIEEYVKGIILNYQDVFPDTDLSKKLGISRKSLWEKRKKYGITRKK